MSYSVIIGGSEQFPLASITGWSDAKLWIDGLDVETFESLIHLAEYAWTENLATLREQITAALKASPPDDPTVADTMRGLNATLKKAKGDSIFVSDGTSEDDGEADDGWEVGEFDPVDPVNLSIDAIPTLDINRTLNPNSSPTPPDIPSADEIAEQTIGYLDELYLEIEDRLLAGQPIGDLAANFDRLVAQADLSGWIAGAVGVWHDSKKPRLYTLDALGGLPTRRFPWIEEAARWLMDRNVYSAQEIQAQARGEFEPRWKSLEAVTLVRNEIANGFVVGESFEEFHKRIRDKVDATKPELQNAFRTATHQAYIVGTTNTLEKPLVKLQFPFVQYRSAHDVRTRVTHRELDGLLFAVGSAEYDLMRRALNDFNCRCAITSLTDKEATRRKLKPITMAELPREVVAKYGR